MHSPNGNEMDQLRVLDSVFSRLAGSDRDLGSGGLAVADPQPVAATQAREAISPGQMEPPPQIENQADVQAAYQWLLRERRRLEAYTESRLVSLRNEHGEMVARYYMNEQSLITRSQELASKEDYLNRQKAALEEQAQKLTELRQELAGHEEQVCRMREELAALGEAALRAKQDTEAQHALLDSLRSETTALLRDRQRAKEELEAFQTDLRHHQEGRAKEEEALAVRKAELDLRILTLAKKEQALQERAAECEEMEERLWEEIEDQHLLLAEEWCKFEAVRSQSFEESPLLEFPIAR